MQGLNEIRHHLQAVSQTRQITNAMYLLSSSRMRKAMTHIEYNREYYHRLRTTIKDILSKTHYVQEKYLHKRNGHRASFVVVASDKGLAGAYNSNVLNFALEKIKQFDQYYIATVGVMATDFFRQHGIDVDIEYLGAAQDPNLDSARDIANNLMRLYDEDLMDEVYLISTQFMNSASHQPRATRFLPLNLEDYDDVELEYEYSADMVYEPSPEEVLKTLVPQYAVGLIYDILNQSYASEHSARMNAMKSSMDNADEMIKKLNSQYNRARQFAITQEITEIAGGAQAQGYIE